jgi:hypothetical protein
MLLIGPVSRIICCSALIRCYDRYLRKHGYVSLRKAIISDPHTDPIPG